MPFRLSFECRRRLKRASKRSGKTMTRILEDAILASVPLYAKESA
jgi:predicted DNA-binding protein